MLLFLTTMRARNGYRGLHEMVSGTRVVRWRTTATASRLRDVPIMPPAVGAQDVQAFGPFRVIGVMGESGPVTVLQGRDDKLDRSVWIHLRKSDGPALESARLRVARPTRPRWLQGGTVDGLRWDAFEAVVGAPLTEIARRGQGLEWARGRFVLLDLAEELAGALSDGTLPSSLALEQVWVDRGGRVKLLDGPLVSGEADVAPEPAPSGSEARRAVGLLRAATRFCSEGQVLPGHAQNFVEELAKRPSEPETLAWAERLLHGVSERTSAMRWDDRLGVLCVSLGTENLVYSVITMILGFGTLMIPGISKGVQAGIPILLCIALIGLLGYGLRGGPVFRFMGIEVRRSDGKPAGRMRCAWRNMVAWAPSTMQYGASGLLLAAAVIGAGQPPDGTATSPPSVVAPTEQPPEATPPDVKDRRLFPFVAILGAVACAGFLNFVGAGYSITHPRRGIQDLLAGTCLVPK